MLDSFRIFSSKVEFSRPFCHSGATYATQDPHPCWIFPSFSGFRSHFPGTPPLAFLSENRDFLQVWATVPSTKVDLAQVWTTLQQRHLPCNNPLPSCIETAFPAQNRDFMSNWRPQWRHLRPDGKPPTTLIRLLSGSKFKGENSNVLQLGAKTEAAVAPPIGENPPCNTIGTASEPQPRAE